MARRRAARAHARRRADDPRERVRRGIPRLAQPAGALPRARTAGPEGSRIPGREARGSRRADAARAEPADAAARRGGGGRGLEARREVRGAVGPGSRGVPFSRPARAEAGALRPEEPWARGTRIE